MWSRNYVDGEQFSNSFSSRSTSVYSSLNSSYVSSYHNGYESAAYEYFTDKGNISSLYHSISCFYGTNKTLSLDHSQC